MADNKGIYADCTNAVMDLNDPPIWHRCEWEGYVKSLADKCPRCLVQGTLAPAIYVPKVEGSNGG